MEEKMDLSEVEKSSDQVRPREVDEADNTDIDAEEVEEPIKSGRGMAMDYAELETLSDYPSALEYMKDQLPEYNLRYKRETERGRKEYYHCAGYLKCPKVIYILLHCESFECSKSCIVITQKKAAKTAKAPVKSSAKPPTRTLETRASKKAKLNVA